MCVLKVLLWLIGVLDMLLCVAVFGDSLGSGVWFGFALILDCLMLAWMCVLFVGCLVCWAFFCFGCVDDALDVLMMFWMFCFVWCHGDDLDYLTGYF